MTVELDDVPAYLLDRGLIGPEAVVDGRLEVVDLSRLNRVFLVTSDVGRCFVLKGSRDGSESIEREGAVLKRLGGLLRDRVPEPVVYDREEGVLVLEAARDAVDLRRQQQRGRFTTLHARHAGRTLARLHALSPETLAELPSATDVRWRLQIHDPSLEVLGTLSAAGVQVIALIQSSPEFCRGLDELHGSWRPTGLVHGDVRWDNFLAHSRPGSARRTRLQLIDWEMCGPGEPALDVGAFFAEYLQAWLDTIAFDDRDQAPDVEAPLQRAWPAVHVFWAAYSSQSGASAPELIVLLQRSMSLCAARLATAALEESLRLAEVSVRVEYVLQLAANVLRHPREAAESLFGLVGG